MAAYENRGQSDDWFTPRYVFDALNERFDLDVASPREGPRHVPATRWLWELGEIAPWSGYIFMNPPYGNMKTKRIWLGRFFSHEDGGIALMPDRTSSPWWQQFAPMASAILFMNGKIRFEKPDGTIGMSPGCGTTLFANGERAKAALLRSGLGFVMVPAQDPAGSAAVVGRPLPAETVGDISFLTQRAAE